MHESPSSETETAAAETVAAAPAQPDDTARNRRVITLLIVAAFTVILNETILSVALPNIMGDLRIVETTAQWLQTAFMLTMAIVIPTTGFLLQRLTTRTVFLLAMGLFTAGTAISALSPGFTPLLLGRIVQASGTAIMMPLLMTTVLNLVPPHRRGAVMGNISIVISVAPAIGPTISGLVLQVAPWRFLFLVVLPIAALMLAAGARWVENVSETSRTRIDLVSVILSAFGFGGLIYGLGTIAAPRADGSLPVAPVIALVIGVLALAVFIRRQLRLQRTDSALLDLRTFTYSRFRLALIVMILAMGAMFGVIILLPMFLQRALGYETLQVGLMLLPGGLLMGLLSRSVGRAYDAVGPRPLVIPGAILLAASLLALSRISLDTGPLYVLTAHIVMSLGLALLFTPLFTTALGTLPPHLYSHGSAAVGTLQQVAAGAGTALMVMLMALRSEAAANSGAEPAEALTAGVGFALLVAGCAALLALLPASMLTANPSAGGEDGQGPAPSAPEEPDAH
ncbi:DHA2 family efflux MFS transporter permease subunit [Helcobacillus sp. ACRRO]|uniref:DHA2 family efflux MFS transporter permease subunit n=1 Tax=Helcobacillus sp. ACRRO TaxID=2918202 RepID=UPI001EF441F6|nr:DHA2 family efflux MFS transporter permease subunit [Helcobacillus sp. ACRRO]